MIFFVERRFLLRGDGFPESIKKAREMMTKTGMRNFRSTFDEKSTLFKQGLLFTSLLCYALSYTIKMYYRLICSLKCYIYYSSESLGGLAFLISNQSSIFIA